MPARAFQSSGATDFMPCAALVTPALVEAVGTGGGRTFAWTVNDPDEAERMVEAGVEGVVTDDLATVGPAVRGGG